MSSLLCHTDSFQTVKKHLEGQYHGCLGHTSVCGLILFPSSVLEVQIAGLSGSTLGSIPESGSPTPLASGSRIRSAMTGN